MKFGNFISINLPTEDDFRTAKSAFQLVSLVEEKSKKFETRATAT